MPLAWEGGQGVFHSTVGNSYSQGRVVEPHKEGYPVYGASQPRSVRGEGHVMNFSKVGEVSDWGRSPIVQGHSAFPMAGRTSLVVLVQVGF